jgi:inner membrane protein
MDLVSHAAIGAAAAMLVSRPHEIRHAAIAGAVAGLLPDLDALIRSTEDALLYLEYHRHFSHSLVFIPFGALLVASLLWPVLKATLPFSRLVLFCGLGISLAGFMDACTSYGTQLLWPFVDVRIAWNLISVLDPLFTLLVAIPVVVAVRRTRPRIAGIGLALGAMYLTVCWVQHERALDLMHRYADQLSLSPQRVLVKPTIGNVILWRGMIETRDHLFVAGVRPAIFGASRTYPGEQADRFTPNHYAALPAGRLRSDLDRFGFFADHLLSHSSADPGLIGDARYAMRPDSLKPIWSVRFDSTKPDRRVELITDREMSKIDRAQFLRMLSGAP